MTAFGDRAYAQPWRKKPQGANSESIKPYILHGLWNFWRPCCIYMSKKTSHVDTTGNFANACICNYCPAPSHGWPRRRCAAQWILESYFISFSRHFSFFQKKSLHIFSLWKRKSLQCNADTSMHSCRGRHVENGLKASGEAAAEICVAGLTSDPRSDFSKDMKYIRCFLVWV